MRSKIYLEIVLCLRICFLISGALLDHLRKMTEISGGISEPQVCNHVKGIEDLNYYSLKTHLYQCHRSAHSSVYKLSHDSGTIIYIANRITVCQKLSSYLR